MKRVLAMLILFISISTQAQVWVSHGATWYYEWSGILPAFDKIEYVSDTMIQSKNCQKLLTTSYMFAPIEAGGGLVNTLYSQHYTYVNGDTVFYLVDSVFHVLYNFGAQIGDTWDLGVDTNQSWCTHSMVEVQSTGSSLINGQNCDWIYVGDLPYSSVGLSGKIYKRFGAVDDYLFPTHRNCDSAVVEYIDYRFSCFEDDSFSLYNVTSKDCDYLFHIGINEFDQKDNFVSLFPNPASDVISVSVLRQDFEITNIRIFDTKGRTAIITNRKEIDVSQLSQGLYFVMIDFSNGQRYFKKFIKN